jgi:hypothetical protein
MTTDRNLVAAAWNDPRSPRALTLAAFGAVCVYQGIMGPSEDLARESVIVGGLLFLPVGLLLFLKAREASVPPADRFTPA